jgi:tetratricopeptide (TPR) repeat protein
VLERYLPDLLGRAFAEMSTRYGIRPAKTKVEVFASEDHFARRSVGLPHVGVQGICFGKVVVAGGPRAAPVNVGQVLWHELAHVFTIQASRSRVPRWLTEGLSVREESRGSAHWVRGDDAALYRWVKAGRMPGVEALNTAFSRARSGPEIGLAYYGSAKLVEHIERQHGMPKLLQMLKLFGQGKRSADVIRTTLKMTPDELDRQFQADLLKRLAHYEKNFQVDYGWDYDLEALEKAASARPNDAATLGRAAVGALANRDKAKAEGYAARALKIDPAQPQARHVLSDIGAATKSFAAAKEHAAALIARGVDGYGLRLNLVEAAAAEGNAAKVVEHLRAAAAIDPQQVEPRLRLAKLDLDAGREADAIRELGLAADLDPHDASLHEELVERLAKRGDWAGVVRYGERSLWIDPFDADLHLRLATAYEETGNAKRAAFEYESALLCEPEDLAAVHLGLARFHQRAGKRQLAVDAARRGVDAGTKSSPDAQRFLDEVQRGGAAGKAPAKGAPRPEQPRR